MTQFHIKPYQQHRSNCAIACMLMTLEYYQIIPKANYFYEREYERRYHSRYMDGTPFSAIAYHLSKNHLNVQLIHSEKEYFTNQAHFLPEPVFQNTMQEYQSYLNGVIEMGGKVKTGVDLTVSFLKEQLQNGYLIISAGMVGKVLHAILICGYDFDKFIICDPLYRKRQIKSQEELETFMSTPIGKWCILVKNDAIS